MEFTSKILSIISQNAKCERDIRPEDRIVEDLGVDSLDKLMIIQDIEDEYNITVEDDELKNIKVVQDILDAIERKISITHV
jgi:acyl carrier protein